MAKKKNTEEITKYRYDAYCTNHKCSKEYKTNSKDEVVPYCACGTRLTWNDHKEMKTLILSKG
jgi:hypothetical protein